MSDDRQALLERVDQDRALGEPFDCLCDTGRPSDRRKRSAEALVGPHEDGRVARDGLFVSDEDDPRRHAR